MRQRGLNETYTGGISSFLLLNLVLTYILYTNKQSDTQLPTLGHLLCGFLQFYAWEFNYNVVGISIRHGGFFYKKED